MNQFNNMSPEQIIARIEDYKAEGISAIKDICVALRELRLRNVKHPLHRDRVYQWFNEVADGRLHAGLVALFNGNRSYLKHIIGRPMEVQKAMLAGRDFDVVFERKGEIVDGRKSVLKMSLQMFQRLLPEGERPRTLSEQREALEVELASKPKVRTVAGPIVRAIKEEGVLMVGTTRVPLTIITAALKEVGYNVKEE